MEQEICRVTKTRRDGANQMLYQRPPIRQIQTVPVQRKRPAARETLTESPQRRNSASREALAAPAQRRSSAPREALAVPTQHRNSAQQKSPAAPVQRRRPASPEVLARRRKMQKRKKRRHMLWVTARTVVVLLLCAILVGKGWEYLLEQREIRQAGSDSDSSFAVLNSDGSVSQESLSMDSAAVQFPEGTDYKKYLENMAEESPQIKEILANLDQYPDKLLEMLAKNPETLDFVLNYPAEKDKEHKISIEDTYVPGEIPLYIQWDSQWGYDRYGDGMIALDGCGPTCLSMVYIGLTGDTSMNPREMADYSNRNGYLTSSGATAWDLMLSGASGLGLTSGEVSLDESVIRRELEAGRPIICSMRPGDFTTTGHFIVLTGIAEDGSIIVNDPNSRLRSQQTWELNRLMKQMKNLWSFSK